jgi:hypothetical protein
MLGVAGNAGSDEAGRATVILKEELNLRFYDSGVPRQGFSGKFVGRFCATPIVPTISQLGVAIR